MKVAVVTNILTPYRIPLFEELNRLVDRLSVLLMAEHEDNRQWVMCTPNFPTVILPGVHLTLAGSQATLHLNYGTRRRLRKLAPDIVLSGGFSPANLAALAYCRVEKKAFVNWGEIIARGAADTNWVRSRIRRLFGQWSDGAIASSSEAKSAFVQYGIAASNIVVSPMPIDVESMHSSVQEWVHCDTEDGVLPFSRPILLSVGRLIDSKGYYELFAMFAEVIKSVPNASLVIVGDGPGRKEYEAYVRDKNWHNVHFVGFLQRQELTRYYAGAEVFVFHTLLDRYGAVLAEAMAAELPVASSIYAAATEHLIEEGLTGFCIDPRDANQTATTILKMLLMTKEERRAIGSRAYAKVKQYDISNSARDMVKFLETVVRKKRVSE